MTKKLSKEVIQKLLGNYMKDRNLCESHVDKFNTQVMHASIIYDHVLDVLEEYTVFLQQEGYLDMDATLEEPTAINRFITDKNI